MVSVSSPHRTIDLYIIMLKINYYYRCYNIIVSFRGIVIEKNLTANLRGARTDGEQVRRAGDDQDRKRNHCGTHENRKCWPPTIPRARDRLTKRWRIDWTATHSVTRSVRPECRPVYVFCGRVKNTRGHTIGGLGGRYTPMYHVHRAYIHLRAYISYYIYMCVCVCVHAQT